MRYEIVLIQADRFAPASYRAAPRVRQDVWAVTSTRAAADEWVARYRARTGPGQPEMYVTTAVVREVDVEPVHVEPTLVHAEPEQIDATSWSGWSPWVYWSDDAVTAARFVGERPQALRAAAVGLINLMRASDRPDPACGWARLARVAEVIAREEIATVRGRGAYLRDTVERLRVLMADGEERDLWMRTSELARGVACDVHDERPAEWCLNRRGVLEPWRR